jgi:hypothetical protein
MSNQLNQAELGPKRTRYEGHMIPVYGEAACRSAATIHNVSGVK